MKSILATLVGATLLAAVPAQAATDLYLKIDGIKGESKMKGYEGAIDVLAWSWGVSNSGHPLFGAGKTNVQDFSWTQYLDSSYPDLFSKLTTGTDPGKATLYAVKPGVGGYNYFQAIFDGNLLSSLSTGGSGGEDRFTLNATMAMTSITLRYLPDPTKPTQWVEAFFDQSKITSAAFSGDPQALRGLSLAMVSEVPEPASWALMLGGLLLTGVALRRRLPS